MSAKRLRYYTSMEEATLVRLWRENLHEISSYTENLPIYRDISLRLQQCKIKLNKREVQRRILKYRKQYLSERKRMETAKDYKSDWRLYSMVHCLFNPAQSPPNAQHQQQILEHAEKEIRKECPDLESYNYKNQARNEVKFERDPDGCAFFEADQSQLEEMEEQTIN